MGFFNLFRSVNINEGVETFRQTKGAVLLDVREASEYKSGHIPGSINIPVGNIALAKQKIPNLDTPIFTYCLSGARSSRAHSALKSMGYTQVQNIGGINGYRGPKEV